MRRGRDRRRSCRGSTASPEDGWGWRGRRSPRYDPGVGWRTPRWAASVCALWLVAAASTAHAQLALEWRAPAGCPRADAVRADVDRLLGGEVPALAASGEIVRTADGWELRLRVGAEGERVLVAHECRLLAEATALILALAIDPVRVVEVDEGPATSGAVEPPPARSRGVDRGETPGALGIPRGVPGEALVRPEDPAVRARAQATPRRLAPDDDRADAPGPPRARDDRSDPPRTRDARVDRARSRAARRVSAPPLEARGVLATGGVEIGALPAANATFSADVRAQLGRLALEAGAVVSLPREAALVGDTPGRGGRLGAGALRGALLVPFAVGPLRLAPVVLAELGVVGARGRGVSDPRLGWAPWIAVGLGAHVDVRLGQRALVGLSADARLPLWRPAFVLEPAGEVHRASPVVGRFLLRVGAFFR